MFFKKFISGLFILLFLAVAALLLVSSFRIPGVPVDVRVVLTGSMEPAVKTGSVVFISPSEIYTEGDIITFQRKESRLETPITHRIISVSVIDGEYAYRTKGDANDAEDLNPVSADEVFGKVRLSIPFVGYVLSGVKTPWGFAIIIILPAILIILEEAKKIRREVKKDSNENV